MTDEEFDKLLDSLDGRTRAKIIAALAEDGTLPVPVRKQDDDYYKFKRESLVKKPTSEKIHKAKNRIFSLFWLLLGGWLAVLYLLGWLLTQIKPAVDYALAKAGLTNDTLHNTGR